MLVSDTKGRDIKIDSYTLSFHGRLLIEGAEISLNYGQRYGLLGENGSGKVRLLLARRAPEYPHEEHLLHCASEQDWKSVRTGLLSPVRCYQNDGHIENSSIHNRARRRCGEDAGVHAVLATCLPPVRMIAATSEREWLSVRFLIGAYRSDSSWN